MQCSFLAVGRLIGNRRSLDDRRDLAGRFRCQFPQQVGATLLPGGFAGGNIEDVFARLDPVMFRDLPDQADFGPRGATRPLNRLPGKHQAAAISRLCKCRQVPGQQRRRHFPRQCRAGFQRHAGYRADHDSGTVG